MSVIFWFGNECQAGMKGKKWAASGRPYRELQERCLTIGNTDINQASGMKVIYMLNDGFFLFAKPPTIGCQIYNGQIP